MPLNFKPVQFFKPALLTFAVCLVLTYANTFLQASLALNEARRAAAAGRFEETLDAYQRAASWQAPLNFIQAEALEEFFTFALSQPEGDRNNTSRLEALRRVRSALLSSRSFLNPYRRHAPGSIAAKVEAELNRLLPDKSPAWRVIENSNVSYGLQFLSGLLFLGWISAALWTIYFGFTPHGSLRRAEILKGISVCLLFYVFWLSCLRIA